jgi:heme/copper-type cytochrome/quinol oxidase subunit 2
MQEMLRRLRFYRLHIVLPFVAVGAVILLLPLPMVAIPSTHSISLEARQYQFTPGRIEVHQGDHVVITLSAADVTHGFYLEGYGIEQRIVPGVAQQITFTADQPGKFRYRCSVGCGAMHPFMLGEFVVQANVPFSRALGVMLTALIGTLVFLWHSGRTQG